jgi:methyl-accepting chemotaxis protein
MRITVGTKIGVTFGLCLTIMISIGVASFRSTTHLIDATNLVAHTYEVLDNLQAIPAHVMEAESDVRGYLITGQERYLGPVEGEQKAAHEALKRTRTLTVDNPSQQRRLDVLDPLLEARLGLMREMVETRRSRGANAAVQDLITDKANDLTRRIQAEIADMREVETELLRVRTDETKSKAAATITSNTGGTRFGVLLCAVAGFLLYRAITRPLAAFRQFVAKVGEGDLTQLSVISSSDELGDLSQSLNRMVAGLKDVASQTRAVVEHLNSSTSEILASARQQAASTGEQAAAVQQTNVTMQELSQSGVQISERAKQVSTIAQTTSKASTAGMDAIQSTNRTMEAIRDQAEAVAQNVVTLSERTQAVGEIIATVNDLAEQAHLLSLNAAIEAAAAGEHGRTFSVVASEIKNLADRSKDATIQIRSLLGEIQKGINNSVMLTEEAVKRVESGKLQADVTARTIRELTEGVEQSVQAFQQIVAGTNQQQIGFEQVTLAIRDIGQASEQTAASVHQLEGASAHLTTLGQQLRTAVERYTI